MPEIPTSLDERQRRIVRSILDAHGFDELTQTQYEAFDGGLLEPYNGLLVAETGNGKTLVAESVVKQTLIENGQVAYLVPSTQLRNAKQNELNEWAERDGYTIGTGGWGMRNADVTVCTFEQFYQLILQGIGGARDVDRVILDDFHEIYSNYRGPNIESALAAILEAGVRVFGISATLGNPVELAEWLGNATLVVSDETRTIPIQEHPMESKKMPTKKEYLANLVDEFQDSAPFLIFNNSKTATRGRAEEIDGRDIFPKNDTDHLAAIENALSTTPTDGHKHLAKMMGRGIAYHHSDLERDVREVVVDAIQSGDVRCLCCTPGLAYGFDAPIQTVIAADLRMFNGTYMEYIGCWEYLQWIGRAGRQGHGFDVGHAIPLWNDYDEAAEIYQFDTPTGEKELSDVTTHINDEMRLRWLFLDLVATRWQTTDEIEEFFQHTLYWEQLRNGDPPSWGSQHATPEDELQETLHETATWLSDSDFLSHSAVNDRFSLPALGEAAVEFNRNIWTTHTLSRVHSYHQYLGDSYIGAVQLLSFLSDVFDVKLPNVPDSDSFSNKCRTAGIGTDDAGLTAGVIAWHWCTGQNVTRIEEELDFDPVGLSRTAADLSSLVRAGKHLFDAHPTRVCPDWWDTLADQLHHGVKASDLALVDAVNGLGRKRGLSLRMEMERYMTENSLSVNGESTLADILLHIREHGSVDFHKLVVTRVDGIGDVIADRIDETIAEWADGTRPPVHDPFGNTASSHHLKEKRNTNTTATNTRNSTLTNF